VRKRNFPTGHSKLQNSQKIRVNPSCQSNFEGQLNFVPKKKHTMLGNKTKFKRGGEKRVLEGPNKKRKRGEKE